MKKIENYLQKGCHHSHISVFFSILFIFVGCYMATQKILFHSSFEKDNNPSIGLWKVSNPAAVKFREVVPKNGGKYSLYIEGQWGPPTMVYTAIPAVPGIHNYRLSLMARRDNLFGTAWFGIYKDSALVSNFLRIKDTSWTKYSMEKTIDSKQDDSIYIYLRGGFSELLRGGVYFDNVKLEETD